MTRLSSDELDAVALPDKPWVKNKPEDRLNIATGRLLDRTLERPRYFTHIKDSDDGARTDFQRMRDQNRGIHKGQLDWDVVQGNPPIARKLENKRGYNKLTTAQKQTVADLNACGFPPITAWTLREVRDGLRVAGFRFTANCETVLRELEAHLAAWDREAELVKSGAVVKKRATPRKAGPRYAWGKLPTGSRKPRGTGGGPV